MLLEHYQVLTGAFIFIFGLMVGSFLNVCIWRLPRGQSVSQPRNSRCPQCGTELSIWDNIPVLSFILLRAKCRYCGEPISWRYPMVEALTGCLFFTIYVVQGVYFGTGPGQLVIMCLVASLLIVSSGVDFEYRIIPDEISLYGIVGGLLAGLLLPHLHVGGDSFHTLTGLTGLGPVDGFIGSLTGAIGGGGIVLLFAIAGALVFRQDALGIGDVKLMAMVGAFLGWKIALIAFFVAPFFGLLYAFPLLVFKDEHHMPYGPFLSAGSVLAILFRAQACQLLAHYGRVIQQIFYLVFID